MKRFKFIKLFIFGCFYLSFSFLHANKWENARILSHHKTIQVVDEDELIVNYQSEVVITDKSEWDYGFDQFSESKFFKLMEMKAVIYDTTGKMIKKLKKSDIQKSSVTPDAVYNEHLTHFHQLKNLTFPYRIVKSKKYKINSTFFWPDWDPQHSLDVDTASLQIVLKKDVPFKYRLFGNLSDPVIQKTSKGYQEYLWTVGKVPRYEPEYRSAPESRFQIGVKMCPSSFNLGMYIGDNSSWSSIGNCAYQLYQDRLNEPVEMLHLTQYSQITDPLEKINKVYQYLQNNTRYVQIYLNIDGWRPHALKDIHQNKYGDCKDLSLYFIAMLKQLGIEAMPALVLTRNKGVVDPVYPDLNFNHVIAVVPINQDTLFIESTGKSTTYDNPPSSIEDTNILLLKEENSQLLKIPLSNPNENISKLIATAVLRSDRSLLVNGRLVMKGDVAQSARQTLKYKNEKEKKDWLIWKFSNEGRSVQLDSMEIQYLDVNNRELIVQFSMNILYFSKKISSRFVFNPNIINPITFKGEKPEDRIMPLLNRTTYTYEHVINFRISEKYKIKNRQMIDTLKTSHGELARRVSPSKRGFNYYCKYTSHARYVSLDAYIPYYTFMNDVKKKYAKKVVLIRKD